MKQLLIVVHMLCSLAVAQENLQRWGLTPATEPVKCGFPQTINNARSQNRNTDKPLLRPSNDTSIVSPRGYFRIHFDKSGFSAPAYSVTEFAKAADSAYAYETAYLGFLPAPGDNGAGGDDKYDVYIQNISGYYGFTEPEMEIRAGSGVYYSYIVVHNSFAGYYTTGLEAAKVTIAHEYHHAIQIGCYIARFVGDVNLDQYFYELTSTSMEEMVFPEVNDYVAYARDLFNRPDVSFVQHSGYDLAVWNLYLKAKFDASIFRKQWELMKQNRAVLAIGLSLEQFGSSLPDQLSGFTEWLFFTAYRNIQGKYFPDAALLPQLKPMMTVVFTEPGRKFTVSVNPFSIGIVKYVRSSGAGNDTVYTLAVNAEYTKCIDSSLALRTYTDGLYSQQVSGAVQIAAGYYRVFSGGGGSWQLTAFINNSLAGGGNSTVQVAVDAYPSPFVTGKTGSTIIIPFKGPAGLFTADMQVLNTAGVKVFSGTMTIINAGERYLRFTPKDNNGTQLPSGIYIYHFISGSYKQTGKLVIING